MGGCIQNHFFGARAGGCQGTRGADKRGDVQQRLGEAALVALGGGVGERRVRGGEEAVLS